MPEVASTLQPTSSSECWQPVLLSGPSSMFHSLTDRYVTTALLCPRECRTLVLSACHSMPITSLAGTATPMHASLAWSHITDMTDCVQIQSLCRCICCNACSHGEATHASSVAHAAVSSWIHLKHEKAGPPEQYVSGLGRGPSSQSVLGCSI